MTSSVFFVSDTHFGHRNIIKYCSRPFSSVEEMDETLVANWNNVVGKHDMVYHMGDVIMHYEEEDIIALFSRLNGNKILMLGNHDRHISHRTLNKCFGSVHQIHSKNVMGHDFVMCHYPFRTWDKSHYGAINVHGHVHGRFDADSPYNSVDVGVDSWNFTPVSAEQVIDKVKQKKEKAEFYSHGGMAM